MNNEEAIFIINNRLNTYYCTDEDLEALNKAIEALKEIDKHGNCILTMFGDCSYQETGCSDCKIIEKIGEALKNERPQGEWIYKEFDAERGDEE